MKNGRNHITYPGLLVLCLFCWNQLGAQNTLYLSPGSQVKIDSGTTVTVSGNVKLDSGARLLHNGTLYVRNNGLASVWSDPNVSGGMNGTGRVVFQGIIGTNYSGFTRFHDLTIDGGPVNITGKGTLAIANKLLLRKGVINTGSAPAIQVLNPAFDAITAHSSNAGYSQSYINGKLTRKIGVNGFVYDFPVGDPGNVHLLTFINHFLTGVSSLNASFGSKQGTDAGMRPNYVSSFVSVNNDGVWLLEPDGSATGGSYGLQLSVQGFTGLVDNQFSILARPFNSSYGEDWIIPSGSLMPEAGASGRTVASGYTLRENLTGITYTQFGIGMSLPLLHSRLGDLNVKRNSANQAMLNWNTLSEASNSGFFVERRIGSALTFTDLTFVISKSLTGNSTNLLNYAFSDPNHFTETSYYRLRQVSKDGSIAYSNIAAVPGIKTMVRLSPNPTNGILNISVPNRQDYTLVIINAEGRQVMKQKLAETGQIQLNRLASGTYTVALYNAINVPVLAERVVLLK